MSWGTRIRSYKIKRAFVSQMQGKFLVYKQLWHSCPDVAAPVKWP